MKKFQVLILSTSFTVINHFCKKLLNHSYVAKIYKQKIFFEHIFLNETHHDIEITSKLKSCKQFIYISKFFIIILLSNNCSNRYNIKPNIYYRNVERSFIKNTKSIF